MLLSSALPCDFLAPSLARSSVIAASPYHSQPLEETGIVSATTTGLLQTCRRLQQILSGSDRMSPVPTAPLAPMTLSVASQSSGIRKSTRRTAPSSSAPTPTTTLAAQEAPRTPSRRALTSSRLPPKTPAPRLTHKRTRSAAFLMDTSHSEESDNSDKDFNRSDLFTTPPNRGKRVRLTTPPPAPNRGIRGLLPDSDDEMDLKWTDDDDRQLVEMVLGRLQLTKSDWEECARTLGKGDSRSVGKRWEDLLGSVTLKDRRKRIGRLHQRRIFPRN